MAEDAWALFASLTEPQRRDLYTYVREQHRPVTREEAAEACGMSRSLAAFHLDKLVEAGLLTPARPRDGGPKRTRGRPPKSYETTDVEIRFVLPERRLDLLADVLMDAVAARPDNAWQEAVENGHRSGEQIGREYRPRPRTGKRGRAALVKALTDVGAEPHAVGDDRLVLANCPFRAHSRRRPELVCEIYRAFCGGLANGVGVTAQAVADPSPGHCCVAVRW